MDGKKILPVQHGKEIRPGGILRLFGVVKKDVHTLMIFLDYPVSTQHSTHSTVGEQLDHRNIQF